MRVGDREKHTDIGILALKLTENDGNDDRRRTRGGTQDEIPGEVSFTRCGDRRDELILESKHPLRAAIEPPTRLRRFHAPTRTVEKLSPEPLLERAHL